MASFQTFSLLFFRNQFSILKSYINRYVRYIPAVVVLILFFASSLPLLFVGGPFVGNITAEVEKCSKWWWTSLLFIQNYMNLKENCMNHTWYLSGKFKQINSDDRWQAWWKDCWILIKLSRILLQFTQQNLTF